MIPTSANVWGDMRVLVVKFRDQDIAGVRELRRRIGDRWKNCWMQHLSRFPSSTSSSRTSMIRKTGRKPAGHAFRVIHHRCHYWPHRACFLYGGIQEKRDRDPENFRGIHFPDHPHAEHPVFQADPHRPGDFHSGNMVADQPMAEFVCL
jgi:hypothetical protein